MIKAPQLAQDPETIARKACTMNLDVDFASIRRLQIGDRKTEASSFGEVVERYGIQSNGMASMGSTITYWQQHMGR